MSVVETVPETLVAPVTRREVLHRAADLLEEFGWTQGQWGDCEQGARTLNNVAFVGGRRASSFCMVGAQGQAARDLGLTASMNVLLHTAYEWDLLWNDEPGRTREEVVARLRQAAEEAA